MDSLLNKNISYAALDFTLRELGFHCTSHETHRLYEGSNGAVIVIPQNLRMEDQARPVHLLTARRTVVEMGISDEASFDESLLKSAANLLTGAGSSHPVPPRTSASKRAASISTFEVK